MGDAGVKKTWTSPRPKEISEDSHADINETSASRPQANVVTLKLRVEERKQFRRVGSWKPNEGHVPRRTH